MENSWLRCRAYELQRSTTERGGHTSHTLAAHRPEMPSMMMKSTPESRLMQSQLRMEGHVARMSDERLPK